MCGKYRFFFQRRRLPKATQPNSVACSSRTAFSMWCILLEQDASRLALLVLLWWTYSALCEKDAFYQMSYGHSCKQEWWTWMLYRATEQQSTKYSRLTGVLWPGNKLLDCSTYEFNLRQSRTKRTVFYSQAIDLPAGPGTFSPEDAKSALKVVNMTKTNYLMGMCPLFIGMGSALVLRGARAFVDTGSSRNYSSHCFASQGSHPA